MKSGIHRSIPFDLRVTGTICVLLVIVAVALAHAWPASAEERPNSDPEFLHASYRLSIAENAAVGTAVGTIPAADFNDDTLSYTITAGNEDGRFAIDGETGTVTVAVALDHETTSSYTLTLQVDDGHGGTATAAVTITVTACTASEEAPEPAAVTVDTVPIVVTSTTDEYFVLYVSHETTAGGTVEWPVAVIVGEEGTTTLSENVEALPAERYRVEKYQLSDPADVDGDCVDDVTELENLGEMSPVSQAKFIASQDGVVAIPDWDTFDSQARDQLGGQQYLKFTATGMDTDRPALQFMNTNTYAHHWAFLQAIGSDSYNDDDAYHGRSVTGEVIYAPKLTAPDGSLGMFYWRIAASQYRSFETTARVHTLLAAGLGLIDGDLAVHIRSYMLPYLQSSTMPSLRESRVPFFLDHDLLGDTTFVALNPGEGFGRLRQLGADDRPHPRDIVLYEALPNEVPPVAGIISTVPQTPLSHVNLRAVQNGVPNAYVRNALDDRKVVDLIGEYVHFEVTDDGYSIRAATLEEIEAYYASSRPFFPQVPRRDLSVTAITSLSSIGFDDWDAFGVKAANLAVLQTLGFPDGTVPDGFAIPFYFYDEFMKANGLYADIRTMLADEDFQTDYDVQEDELKKLRKKIKKADTPQWIIEALTAMHATFPEGQSLRYRSSTNNEDLPGFNGAGLYDSKTQKPDETVEDGIDKSLKQVYASLWTFRAFSEREVHHVDHLASAMGVLVHPNYTDEQVNGVAVSFDFLRGNNNRYYVNSQLGEDLVTNPEAHSVPEELLLRPSNYDILALSNLVEPGQLLMTVDQMDQLRGHLGSIYKHFRGLYSPSADGQFAMEIEFKITSDDVLAIKQARPWVFPRTVAHTPPRATATDQSVHLTWVVPALPDGFYINDMYLERLDEHGEVEWSTWIESDLNGEEATSWEQSDYHFLVAGTTYRYRVKLETAKHGDVYSYVLPVTTQSESPVPPTGLSTTATHDTVSLSWTVPEQPAWITDSVPLSVMRERLGKVVNVGSVPWQKGVTGYEFTDTDVLAGRDYRYFIRTHMGARYHYSEQVPVTTAPQPEDPDGTREGATVLDAEAAAQDIQKLSGYSLNRKGGDSADYYSFTTTARYELTFGVWRSRTAWDERIYDGVTLEDAAGNTMVDSSAPPENTTRETLETAIDAGTYYVRIEAMEDGPYGYFIRFGLAEAAANAAPAFASAAYSFSIAEDAAVGAAVGSVFATDADDDTLSYSITAGNGDGAFAIDSSNGAITTAGALDHETTPTYTLTVQADDNNGGTASTTVSITVTDVDENAAPAFGSATYNFSIAEDAASGAAVGTVSATDADNHSVTYTIESGNGAGKFAIAGSSGAITTAGELDHETTPSYTLTVQADDGDGGTATATVNVTVTDVDENAAPAFGSATYNFSIAEDASSGSAVGTVTATDADNHSVTYTIESGNGAGKFAIAGSSGAITTAGELNHETTPSYTLTVQADDGNGGTATATVSVTVTDVAETTTGPLEGFTLVDASNQNVLATLTEGSSVVLADPGGGSYGIRANVDANATIGSVRLELSGAKTVSQTENITPYSLYGDSNQGQASELNGEALPAGSYTLRATAYANSGLGGDVLGTLEISFTITASN